MGLWNRRAEEPETEPEEEVLDEDFIQDALRLGRGEPLASAPLEPETPSVPAYEPPDLDPRSRFGPPPDDLDPRSLLMVRNEPADLDPRSRMAGDMVGDDLQAKLAAVEEERERERRASAEARAMVKNRFEEANHALEAAQAEKAALADRLARAEAQAGHIGDAQASLQAAKAENAALAERLAEAERDAVQAIEAAGEWERKFSQAQASLEVARQQAALAAGRAVSEENEMARLRDALRDARADAKRWEETVLDQSAEIEELKSALLQAEERHIKEMDDFLESLRAPRLD